MKIVTVRLKGCSRYSQSKYISEARPRAEGYDDFETRTWRQRLHVGDDGNVVIPQMSFKNCLSEAAKFLSIKIPGKGTTTFTKHFEAGVLVLEPMVLNIVAADVPGEWLMVPSDGKRGGGKRVSKCFPYIDNWEGDVTFHVLDDVITKEIFEEVLSSAGKFIGIGRFRPRNNGFYGRFKPVSFDWLEGEAAEAA